MARFLSPILLVVVLSGCSPNFKMPERSLKVESGWPFARQDLQGSGAVQSNYSGKLDIIWENKSNDKPGGPLTLQNGYLVYPGTKRKIRFYDAETGSYEGRIKIKGVPQTGFLVVGGAGFVATGPPRNRLNCFGLTSGGRRWKQPLRDALGGSIIIDDRLIIGSTSGLLSAVDTADGKTLWSHEFPGRLTAPPVSDGEKIIQPADDGTLYAISIADGADIFAVELGAPLVSSAVAAEEIYLADLSGSVHAVSLQTGEKIWSALVGGPIWSPPALADGRLFVSNGGRGLTALDVSDGSPLWTFDSGEIIVVSPIVVGDVVVVGTQLGRLYTLRAADGILIESRELEGSISFAPVSDGSRVYLATDKGLIICFGEQNETYGRHTQELNTEHEPQ
ncbi:MAG: PQQ-like beta-propeller repeat protein [bacterium]|nr:PQQ-like beta-propeller repeat protein [bacterium]